MIAPTLRSAMDKSAVKNVLLNGRAFLCATCLLLLALNGHATYAQNVTLEELERRLAESLAAEKRAEEARRRAERQRAAEEAAQREAEQLAEAQRQRAVREAAERELELARQKALAEKEAERLRQEQLTREREAQLAREREAEEARQRELAEKKGTPETLRVNAGFYDDRNGTLVDTVTGLVWTREDSESTDYCRNQGMRVPTYAEFRAIHARPGSGTTKCGVSSCKVSPLFRLSGKWYAATDDNGKPALWSVARNNGGMMSFMFSTGFAVRFLCVK